MHKHLGALSILLFACTSVLSANELILGWEFPADHTPAPETFLVSYRSSNAPNHVEQFRIPNLGVASCAAVNGLPDKTENSVCGRPPACLPPAIYVFEVQAEVGTQQSAPTNLANCQAFAGCTYDCAGVTVPPALQALVQPPPPPGARQEPPHPPDPAQVQELVRTFAQTPPPPASPSVSTPPPTTAEVPDGVQRALDKLQISPT